VNVFPTQIEEQLIAVDGLAPLFQIELHRINRMDAMRVHVEANPDAATKDSKATLAATLTNRIKDVVGISVEVHVGDPGTVARSEGKAKRVVDNRTGER